MNRLKHRYEGWKLQEIENNPLTAEDKAMFEMFDREGWDDERRRAYILTDIEARMKESLAAE
ncbi:hypothetical protein [Ponticaulis profundi]|uniref:hypothetical protein n=1 Tax=Ponticaulis profundi TaxID=2665222 RepID=UPI00366C1342